MKYYKNSVFNAAFAILLFILNIKNIKGQNVKCSDCVFNYALKVCRKGDDNCPSYCRPHFYKGECYDCSSIFKNSTSQLYSIVDGKCQKKSSATTEDSVYITSETNEVLKTSEIKAQNSLNVADNKVFIFGDFTYLNQPANTILDESVENRLLCRCQQLTFVDNIFGFNLYKCVNSCPYGYHMYSNGDDVCKKECDVNFPIIIASNNRCDDKCPPDQPYYYIDEGKEYCANKCPSSKPFYYNSAPSQSIPSPPA
jgi:hypothetical protein